MNNDKYFPTPDKIKFLIEDAERLLKESEYQATPEALRIGIEAEIVAATIVSFTLATNATLLSLVTFVQAEFDLNNPSVLAGLFRAGNSYAINLLCTLNTPEVMGNITEKEPCFFSKQVGNA